MASSQQLTSGQTFVPPGLASIKLTAAIIKTNWHMQSFADKSAAYAHNTVSTGHAMQTHYRWFIESVIPFLMLGMNLLDGLFVLISRRTY